ncbi:MAG: hypothetical protein PHU03_04630, partial [Syntrophales bacterium]|nr:hypothetical protein [Syntrophales bacterium]
MIRDHGGTTAYLFSRGSLQKPSGKDPVASLLEFISFLRKSGVRVSLSETLDALETVSFTGYGDRDVLKFSLASALAKSPDEEEIFNACFERYFSGRKVFQPEGYLNMASMKEPGEDLSPLSRMLMEGDGSAISRVLRETVDSMSLDARYPVQREVMVRRILGGMGMESLDGDIAMLSMAGSPLSGSVASGLREAREELLAYTRDYVKTFFEFSVKTPGEDPNRQRNFRL